MIEESIKNEIVDIILGLVDKNKCIIFLFGSFAKGDERRTSDIDVGIICDETIEYVVLGSIKEDLNEKVRTLRKIDLTDFSRVSDKIFLKEALKEIEVWYQGKDCKTNLQSLKKLLIV